MDERRIWQRCDRKEFWRKIAQDDHVVQIYKDDQTLLSSLATYAADGFDEGDSVIVIATPTHLDALRKTLTQKGYPIDRLVAKDQYIPLDANETLAQFMVNGEPNEKYFIEAICAIMNRARRGGKNIRAFGEMVVLLWQKGNGSATIQLEHLWNKFSTMESFCLYCAYPESNFERDAGASVTHICSAHSKLIKTDHRNLLELQYLDVV